jgi:hypothetical protein
MSMGIPELLPLSITTACAATRVIEPGGQAVLVRASNYEICKAAFDKTLFVYATQAIELRQGARVICKSKSDV